MTVLHAPTLPTPEDLDSLVQARSGDSALIGLSLLLWLCAAAAAHAAWLKRDEAPPASLSFYAPALEIATHQPVLDVAPVLPRMGEVMPAAGSFVLEASTALAKDEAESALLKLRLLAQAGALLTDQLR